jgi:hypothetical protein
LKPLADPPAAGYAGLFSWLARLLDVLSGLVDLWSGQARQANSTPVPFGDAERNPREVQAAIRLLRARLAEPWSFGRAARQRWAQPRLRAARTQTYFSDLQRLEDDLGYLQN